jgi:hypothetical protein
MINSARFFAVLGIIFVTETHYPLATTANDNAQLNLANDDGKSQSQVPLEKKVEAAESQNWLFHFQGTEILQGLSCTLQRNQ